MKLRTGLLGLTAAAVTLAGITLASAPNTVSGASNAPSTRVSAPLTASRSTSTPNPQASTTKVTLTSYRTVCKTIDVRNAFWWAPYTLLYGLYVPICYNGSTVWVNGHISPWTWSVGWSTSRTWYGWYNDSSHHWLGVGQNIDATWLKVAMSFTILPRWYINANGQVYAYVDS